MNDAEEMIDWNNYEYFDIEANQYLNEIEYLEGTLIITRDY